MIKRHNFVFLFEEIYWIPYHDYVSGNGMLIHSGHDNYVGRHYTSDGYVIGKVQTGGDFYAAYRGRTYHTKSGHQVYMQYLHTRSLKYGLILGLHPANERRRYKVTLSRVGEMQT